MISTIYLDYRDTSKNLFQSLENINFSVNPVAFYNAFILLVLKKAFLQ